MNDNNNLDERIVALKNDGYPAGQIASTLKEEGYMTKKGTAPNEAYVTNKIQILRKAGLIGKAKRPYNRSSNNTSNAKATWNYNTVNNLLNDESITADKKVACLKVLFG